MNAHWTIYGLTEVGIPTVRYVGYTRNTHVRLLQHLSKVQMLRVWKERRHAAP